MPSNPSARSAAGGVSATADRQSGSDAPPNPYPGLRPFNYQDRRLFFGRESQSEEIARRLGRSRFVAVVGPSGSGKSSLVKAGVLPLVHGGLVPGAGSRWSIVQCRPGERPIHDLAGKLDQTLTTGSNGSGSVTLGLLESTLRRSARGVIEAVRRAELPEKQHVLLIVDQFEELFRFREVDERRRRHISPRGDDRREDEERRLAELVENSGASWAPLRSGGDRRGGDDRRIMDPNTTYADEAAAFVRLLLEATDEPDGNIHVIITMRSDFLGDCNQFRGLPEAINQGEYLVPRMTRDERQTAIASPAALAGTPLTQRLVQQLLNDVGDNPDQLPIMQHALMCTWDEWNKAPGPESMDIGHYGTVGQRTAELDSGTPMDRALSNSANDAYEELSQKRKVIAEKMFAALTETDRDNRVVRRPTRIAELCVLSKASEVDVAAVVETFRSQGRSFLYSGDDHLTADSMIDISHESLIRNWVKLREWAAEEATQATRYRDLAQAAAKWIEYDRNPESLFRGPELQLAWEWYTANAPTRTWSERYDASFDDAKEFLDSSEAARVAQRQREKKTRDRTRMAVVAVIVVISTAMLIALFQRNEARLANQGVARSDLHQAATLLDEGQPSEALAFLARGLRLDPGNSTIRTRIATLLGGRAWALPIWEQVGQGIVSNTGTFSPDGRWVATVSRNNVVQLWDATSGDAVGDPLPHDGTVNATSYSGSFLATASADGLARVWNIPSGGLLRSLDHGGVVEAVAFSPDGRWLLTGSRSGSGAAKLWDPNSGELEMTIDRPMWVQHVAFSSAGVFAIADDKTVQVWDTAGAEPLDSLVLPSRAVHIEFSPDGTRLLLVPDNSAARLWTFGAADLSVLINPPSVRFATFSPDGGTIVTTTNDSVVRLWDSELVDSAGVEPEELRHDWVVASAMFDSSGERMITVGRDNHATRVWTKTAGGFAPFAADIIQPNQDSLAAISPNGNLILTASKDEGAQLTALHQSVMEPDTFAIGSRPTMAVFSSDGQQIAAASRTGVLLLETANGDELLPQISGSASTVSLSRDGLRLLLVASNDTAQVWDLATKQRAFDLPDVSSATFSRDSRWIISASANNVARVFEANGGDAVSTTASHTGSVLVAEFSEDGRRFATGGSDSIAQVWDTRTGQLEAGPFRHGGKVTEVVFSPDGKRLATASDDLHIQVWDLATGDTLFARDEGFLTSAMAFSPDGSRLVVASGKVARIWNPESGALVSEAMRFGAVIKTADFSPNGTLLLMTSRDRTARVWSGTTGIALSEPLPHSRSVSTGFFGPNAETALTASNDGYARVWTIGVPDTVSSEWLGRMAEGIGGLRITPDGSMVAVSHRRDSLKELAAICPLVPVATNQLCGLLPSAQPDVGTGHGESQ